MEKCDSRIAELIAEQESSGEKQKAEIVNSEKVLATRQKTLNEHVNKIRNFESDKKIKNETTYITNLKNTATAPLLQTLVLHIVANIATTNQ